MQLCVNSVQKWVSENGFKFSTSKTVCIHFHQQYGFILLFLFSPDPKFFSGKKTPIKVVKEARFLGLIFLLSVERSNLVAVTNDSLQKKFDHIVYVTIESTWGK